MGVGSLTRQWRLHLPLILSLHVLFACKFLFLGLISYPSIVVESSNYGWVDNDVESEKSGMIDKNIAVHQIRCSPNLVNSVQIWWREWKDQKIPLRDSKDPPQLI